MLHFLRTPERVRFLLLAAAILAPILVGAALLLSWIDSRGMPVGEPNARGGLHYRVRDEQGVKTFPAPLAAVIRPHPEAVNVDVSADTDASGQLHSATIIGRTKEDLARIAAFYGSPAGRVPPRPGSRRYGVSIVDAGDTNDKRRGFRIAVTAQ